MNNDQLIKLYPEHNIEFSYETICHTKINYTEYEISLIIPQSKKYVGLITTFPNNNEETLIFVLFELNRFKKVCGVVYHSFVKPSYKEMVGWLNGTIVYGSIVNNVYVIEDILMYKYSSLRNTIFKEKILKMVEIVSIYNCFEIAGGDNSMVIVSFALPYILPSNKCEKINTEEIPYTIHHLQFRSLQIVKPILNTLIGKNGVMEIKEQKQQPTNLSFYSSSLNIKQQQQQHQKQNQQTQQHLLHSNTKIQLNFSKPQYRKKTVFEIMADYPFDIYKLYAFNNASTTTTTNENHVFVDILYIPDYNTSKFMNSIFRKIKENDNLDYIEESDDEEDFENVNIDKYVDVNKKVNILCFFNFKFKKWVPISIVNENVNGGKIVPITNL